jgi:hypothetical protein
VRLDVQARMQRKSARIGGAAMITLLLGLFCSGRNRLQRKQFLAGARPHRDARAVSVGLANGAGSTGSSLGLTPRAH